MRATDNESAAARRAATCPVRLGGRNRLKRDAPSIMELSESMQSDFSHESRAGLGGLRLNVLQAHMMAQPRNMDDFDDASSVASIETAPGYQRSSLYGDMPAVVHGSWPRVCKQRTPKGAMNIWEVNEALATPAGTDSSESRTPKELQEDASFVHAIFGDAAEALETDSVRRPSHSDSLGNLGADLSHLHLPDGNSPHDDPSPFAGLISPNSLQQIVNEAAAPAPASAGFDPIDTQQAFNLTQLEELTQLEALLEGEVSEESWTVKPEEPPEPQLQPMETPQAPPQPLLTQAQLGGAQNGRHMSNMAPAEPMAHYQPNMPMAQAMLMPMQNQHGQPPYTTHCNMPMANGFPKSNAQAPFAPGSKGGRNGPERKEWSAEEDIIIREGVAEYGCRWRRIASQLPGRSDDAVRNRWNRLKDLTPGEEGADPPAPRPRKPAAGSRKVANAATPSSVDGTAGESGATPDKAPAAKDRPERVSWTRAEDAIIVSSVAELGHKWYQIASRLPGRTDHAIRNRFHRLQAMADDAQIVNERNEAIAMQGMQEPSMVMAPQMQPMMPMQQMQPMQPVHEQLQDLPPLESTFMHSSPLERQRQHLQEQQRQLQQQQLFLQQQERELLQQHQQQQQLYQQQRMQGQMPQRQGSQDQMLQQTSPLPMCA